MLVRMLGLDLPPPSVIPHRMWVGKASGVRSEIPRNRLLGYQAEVERLMVPCHLAALASGGPRSGSMVVVTEFGKSGVRAHIPVEVTGFPKLGRCGVRVLTRLIPSPEDRGRSAKFVLYFEPAR